MSEAPGTIRKQNTEIAELKKVVTRLADERNQAIDKLQEAYLKNGALEQQLGELQQKMELILEKENQETDDSLKTETDEPEKKSDLEENEKENKPD